MQGHSCLTTVCYNVDWYFVENRTRCFGNSLCDFRFADLCIFVTFCSKHNGMIYLEVRFTFVRFSVVFLIEKAMENSFLHRKILQSTPFAHMMAVKFP